MCRKTRFEPSLVVIGPMVWSGHDTKSTKKEKTKSKSKIHHFCIPPSRRTTSTKFCMQGRIPDIFLGFEFQKDRLKMWEQWGLNFWLSHWLGTSHRVTRTISITACAIATSCCISDVPSQNWIRQSVTPCGSLEYTQFVSWLDDLKSIQTRGDTLPYSVLHAGPWTAHLYHTVCSGITCQ